MSDIKQGVTLEIFGEGNSMGPVNDRIREEMIKTQGDIRYDVTWTTLGEYLEFLVKKGVSPNVASFVGATTVREHELGYDDRAPTPEELKRMQELVRQAMREGALGVGSSLIYAPASYAKTDELIALAKAAGEFGGGYISHMRSEGDRFLEALDELIRIAREAKVHAQVYHLKAGGPEELAEDAARRSRRSKPRARQGCAITADMYPYTAGATGLDAAMPPWVQEGGIDAWVAQLKKPDVRKRVIAEMRDPNAQLGEPAARGRFAGARAADRLQDREAQAADRQDARRGREDARRVARGRGDRSRDRGSHARRHGVLPDVGREREARPVAAVGEHRLGCRGAGAGRPVPAEQPASARLRQLRALPRPLRARSEGRRRCRTRSAA